MLSSIGVAMVMVSLHGRPLRHQWTSRPHFPALGLQAYSIEPRLLCGARDSTQVSRSVWSQLLSSWQQLLVTSLSITELQCSLSGDCWPLYISQGAVPSIFLSSIAQASACAALAHPAGCTYLVVALDSIHKGLISHDLGLPIEESLEPVLDSLQLLFADLQREKENLEGFMGTGTWLLYDKVPTYQNGDLPDKWVNFLN